MGKGFKFIDNSDKVMKNIRDVSEKAILEACLLIEGQAKMLAPVGANGSGELRDKINHDVRHENGKIIGEVGSPLMYAIYVEFGTGEFAENGQGRKGGWIYKTPDGKFHFTRGMKPQSFLRPAFRENKENIKKIVSRDLKANFK